MKKWMLGMAAGAALAFSGTVAQAMPVHVSEMSVGGLGLLVPEGFTVEEILGPGDVADAMDPFGPFGFGVVFLGDTFSGSVDLPEINTQANWSLHADISLAGVAVIGDSEPIPFEEDFEFWIDLGMFSINDVLDELLGETLGSTEEFLSLVAEFIFSLPNPVGAEGLGAAYFDGDDLYAGLSPDATGFLAYMLGLEEVLYVDALLFEFELGLELRAVEKIPEPASLALLGLGLAGLGLARRRRKIA